jgi:transporter family protein
MGGSHPGETSIGAHTTGILTALVIASNVIGNVLLSHGMQQVGQIISPSPLDYARAFVNPWAVSGIAILMLWMVLDLALLSRADLTYVLPMTASAYVLIAIAGYFLLNERIHGIRWLAIVIISIGAALAGETPARTSEGPPEDLL